MRRFFKKTNLRTLPHYSIVIVLVCILCASIVVAKSTAIFELLASSISAIEGATATVFFIPHSDENLIVGNTTSIDIVVNAKTPINALGATISFPKNMLEVVSISKEKSFFDLWTEDTTIAEDSGEIRFSGGTTLKGGIVGTGTVLTLVIRAKNPGDAQLDFTNVQVYPNDDSGNPIDTDWHSISYTIHPPPTTTATITQATSHPTPQPDFNNDGKINLIDLSILTFKMLGQYNPRYDLNTNGFVGLDDLSILLSKM